MSLETKLAALFISKKKTNKKKKQLLYQKIFEAIEEYHYH